MPFYYFIRIINSFDFLKKILFEIILGCVLFVENICGLEKKCRFLDVSAGGYIYIIDYLFFSATHKFQLIEFF